MIGIKGNFRLWNELFKMPQYTLANELNFLPVLRLRTLIEQTSPLTFFLSVPSHEIRPSRWT